MNVNISSDNIGLVDAAKDIVAASSTISSLQTSPDDDGKVANALDTATTMFQSNVQCLSHILALRKAEAEMAADHEQAIEEMQEDFVRELMQREVKLEECAAAMKEKEVAFEQLKKEMASMKEELALQGVWASLLTPESFPLPEVVTDKHGKQRLGLSPSSPPTAVDNDKESEEGTKSKQKSHLAAALRMISAQVAKDVLTQSACDANGARVKRRQECFTTKLMEAAWWLQGRVDGDIIAKEQRITHLCTELDRAQESEAAARQAVEEARVDTALALCRRDMIIQDLQSQLLRAAVKEVTGPVSSSSLPVSMAPLCPPTPATPTAAIEKSKITPEPASPDLFMRSDTTLIEGSDMKTDKHPRVHFDSAVSEIKAGSRTVEESGQENQPENLKDSGPSTPSIMKVWPRSRELQSFASFQSPSYNYSHEPYLYTRNRTPSSSSPAARAVGMGRIKAPSNIPTDTSRISAVTTGLSKKSSPTSMSGTATAAARLARERSRQPDSSLNTSKIIVKYGIGYLYAQIVCPEYFHLRYILYFG